MANDKEQNEKTIQSRYKEMDRDRQSMLERARDCAELTIPSLLPPESSDQDDPLPTPYQGLGARGVNNLASKLLLTLLPPNNTFFKLNVNNQALKQLENQEEGLKTKVEQKLSEIEQNVMQEVRSQTLRVDVFEVLKMLIVTGDALLYLPDEGGSEVFKLTQYVIHRNTMGEVLEIITKEQVDLFSLPESVQDEIIEKHELDDEMDEKDIREEEFDLYTRIALNNEGDKWEVVQEVDEIEIEDTKGTYDVGESPWIPLRWTAPTGEDYGRGLVEEYLGDFKTLESLTKALVEGSAVASRIVGLVNPNGVTRTKKLANADNGDFIEGREEDVSFLQIEKNNDYKIIYQKTQEIKERLKHAFLLMDAIRRDAERVTAQEIRMMAKELEDALGGAYSLLSVEFQLPLVKRLMDQMESQGKLPKLPDDTVEPQIVTGIEALGRGHDLDKLMQFMQALEPLGPKQIIPRLNVSDYMVRVATALGMDTSGLVKSEKQINKRREQSQKAETLKNIAPEIMKQMQQQQQQQQQQGGANQQQGGGQ